jgi:ketosteroid isomerase-like protein
MNNQADIARRTLLALAAIAPIASQSAGATETSRLPADLIEAVRAYDQATLRNDIATLAEIVSDDYLLVNSDSSLQDKQSYLRDFSAPDFRVDPYIMQEPMGRVWGESALTGGIMPLGWTQDGVHHSRLLRIAHVWVKREGRWRIIYTQLTRVPQT